MGASRPERPGNPSRLPGDSRGLMNMLLIFDLADNLFDMILLAYTELLFWFYMQYQRIMVINAKLRPHAKAAGQCR
jgi:hypothetical protein